MEQLRDSHLMFEKKLTAFGYMILMIVTIAVIGVVIWSMYAHKPYMLISQGTVINQDFCHVMPIYTGEIRKSFKEEGKI